MEDSGVGPFTRLKDHSDLMMDHPSSAAGALNARCKRTPGLVRFSRNGQFTFSPQGNSSCFGGSVKGIQISSEDIVGALKTGPYSFQVWHCPVVSTKAGEIKRKLVKSPDFTILQGADAAGGAANAVEALVLEVQQSCCWWGRKAAPNVTVIVNPKSGKGRSLQQLQQVILPVLRDAAGLSVSVHQTKHPGHAESIVQSMDPAATDLLVMLGGDGTAYEAVQGMFQRQDWQEAVKIPIAVVPAGSGNGLAASTGMWNSGTAAHAICKGFISPLDLASVFQAPNQRHYMFLSVTYGIMSNLDEGTNHLRWMGELRFVYGMLRELIKGKAYRARIACVPSHGQSTGNTEAVDPDTVPAEDEGRSQNSEAGRLLSHYGAGPECPHLSRLGFLPPHVPDTPSAAAPGWKALGEIGLQYFSVYSPQYVALDFKPNPNGGLSTGDMDLQWMDGGHMTLGRRWQGLNAFLQTTNGVMSKDISTDKVLALMIEPLEGGTWMMVDGEVVQNKILYLEVHSGLARVLVAPGLGGQVPVSQV